MRYQPGDILISPDGQERVMVLTPDLFKGLTVNITKGPFKPSFPGEWHRWKLDETCRVERILKHYAAEEGSDMDL